MFLCEWGSGYYSGWESTEPESRLREASVWDDLIVPSKAIAFEDFCFMSEISKSGLTSESSGEDFKNTNPRTESVAQWQNSCLAMWLALGLNPSITKKVKILQIRGLYLNLEPDLLGKGSKKTFLQNPADDSDPTSCFGGYHYWSLLTVTVPWFYGTLWMSNNINTYNLLFLYF